MSNLANYITDFYLNLAPYDNLINLNSLEAAPKYDKYSDENSNLVFEILLPSNSYRREDLEVIYENQVLRVKTKSDFKAHGSTYSNRIYSKRSIGHYPFDMSWRLERGYEADSCEYKDSILKIVFKPIDNSGAKNLLEPSPSD